MPSEPASLIAGRQQFLQRDPAGTLAKLPDAGESLVDLLLAAVNVGHNPGDTAPVALDDQRFAPLHIIEELGKMSLGFRGLNFAHMSDPSTSRFDQFNLITSWMNMAAV